MKKKCAIVFGITNDYVFALANVLFGIKEKCTKFYDDIIVYHDGITQKDKNNLNKIIPCKFIIYDKADNIHLNKKSLNEYSKMTLSRFECFNLLEKYKYVIWQDVDILIQKDFIGLMEYANKSGYAATKSDCNIMVEGNFFELINQYNMFSILWNAGIIVFSDKLKNYERYNQWCYSTLKKYNKKIRYLDQGVLNLLIQEFKIDVEEIDILKYCCHPEREEAYNASIVHAYGKNKFWNSEILKKEFPLWVENNRKWREISGEKELIKTTIKKQPLVSVIMSVYTRTEYLDNSIRSILNQTYENLELLIIVEKSSITKKICDFIKKYNDPRIKIIQNSKKIGFAKSLNIGFKKASGKYIARMDDDDISILDRIQKQVDFMEKNKNIGVVGTYMQMFMNSNQLCTLPTESEKLKIQCLQSTPLFHPTVMIRKSIIEKFHLKYDPNYFTEDYDLWSRIVEYTKIANIPEVLLKYRASLQNTTTKNEQKIHTSHKKIINNQLKKYLKLNLNDNEIELLQNRKDIIQNTFNAKEALLYREKVFKKILIANQKTKFYNQTLLEQTLKQKSKKPHRINLEKRKFYCIMYKYIRFLLKKIKGDKFIVQEFDPKFKIFIENHT